MIETRNLTIEQAIDVVNEEIDVIENEIQTVSRFRSRIRDLEPERSIPNQSRIIQSEPGASPVQKQIVADYHETVMAMDHYDVDYGYSLSQEMAFEFGETFTKAFFSAERVTPTLFRSLLSRCEESVEIRKIGHRDLKQERDSLQWYDRELRKIETTFAELPPLSEGISATGLIDTLRGLEEQCDDLAVKRQEVNEARQNKATQTLSGNPLYKYLYDGELPTQFPVLYDLSTIAHDIRTQLEGVNTSQNRI